ncbi:MAG: proline racemase family protein [Fimbriimonadaceae bacterium]
MPILEQADYWNTHHADLRSALCNEPYGSDIIVGAWLGPSEVADYRLIFFNNVGLIGMCGHGLIGVMETLSFLGEDVNRSVSFETRKGLVSANRDAETGLTTIQNVASYRYRKDVPVRLSTGHSVTGDIAYGGNWFFLCEDHGLELAYANIPQLMQLSVDIRRALEGQSITGEEGAQIDHIELTQTVADHHGRNFVLCPGLAYDRSPCGTGTSAKLACLAADGKLSPGEKWVQESITGSQFEARYQPDGEFVIPQISGRAFVTAESELYFNNRDPFHRGIPQAENLP